MRPSHFVLVEFARAWQEEHGAARVDPEVAEWLRGTPEFAATSDPADRLVLYARALLAQRVTAADGLGAPARVQLLLLGLAWCAPILGILTGLTIAQVSLPPPATEPVFMLRLLAAAVLVPALFLVWTALAAPVARRVGVHAHPLRWLLELMHGWARETEVGRLALRVVRREGLAPALLASWSHTLWIAALGSFLLIALWRFVFRDYLFAWSSTLPFTGEQVHTLFEVLAAPFGAWPALAPPGLEQVRVSEWGSLRLLGAPGGGWVHTTGDLLRDQELRKAWVGPLLGIIALWGLLPRLVGLALARHAGRLAIRRGLADPATLLVLLALSPAPTARGVEPAPVAGSGGPVPMPKGAGRVGPWRVGRGLQLVRFAAEAPSPAELEGSGLRSLGLAGEPLVVARDDDDAGMDSIYARLGAETGPEGAVVVFDFASIPDRLKEEFLGRVVASLPEGAPIHVLLVAAARFAATPRGGRSGGRREAWVALAQRAGVASGRVHGGETP